jgi:hypothetical protein
MTRGSCLEAIALLSNKETTPADQPNVISV